MKVVTVPNSAPKTSAIPKYALALLFASYFASYVLSGFNLAVAATVGVTVALAEALPVKMARDAALDAEALAKCLPKIASGQAACWPGSIGLGSDGFVHFAASPP